MRLHTPYLSSILPSSAPHNSAPFTLRSTRGDSDRAMKGFTLAELIISLAILSILTVIAIPSWRDMYYRNMASDTMYRLSHLIYLARSEAVSRSTTTTLCPSNNGTQCGGDWQDGILLFRDNNQNRKLDKGEAIVRVLVPFVDTGELNWHSLGSSVQFSALGMPRGTVGSFVYCPVSGEPELGKARILSFQGKLRKGRDSNKDHIEETSAGKNIQC